jgi:lipopolysaccharide/colanic/teichoic acid biosynthesis glycosyltransferase
MTNLQRGIKRLSDILLSIILLIILSPVLILIVIAIKLEGQSAVLFPHQRIGKDMKLFTMYKFCSMRRVTGEQGQLPDSAHDPRITKVGRFIRAWSLDELPQLWNVLKGEMSLVGPRPRTIADLPLDQYSKIDQIRFRMRPGLTGLAQVSGRNNLSWSQMMLYDVEYVQNYNLWLDIKILFKTSRAVFAREGIYRS